MYILLSCFNYVQLLLTLWTVVHQTHLSMGFSRQEHWTRLPFPSPGDFPDPGIKPVLLAIPSLQTDFLPLSHWGSLFYMYIFWYLFLCIYLSAPSLQIRSDQISHSVVSDSLRPHELQHARPPCPSPTPRAHSDSCPSSQWCHPAISSSVVPFSSCPQSLPASESFPMSQRWPKYWSFSFSIIPSKEIPGLISFRMVWLDLLAVQGTLKSLPQHHNSKASILRRSAFFTVQLSHDHWKNHSLD